MSPARTAPAPAKLTPKLSAADHWRLAYERTAAQLEIALQLLQRQAGPMPKTAGPRVPEDVDDKAVARAEARAVEREVDRQKKAERDFIDRAAADLVQRGANPVAAEREARALWQATTDFHPAG